MNRYGPVVLSRIRGLLEGTRLEAPSRFVFNLLRAPKNTVYDLQAKAVMRRVLSPASVCVDIGSHKGEFLKAMVALAPEGRHQAFEPLPEMGERLKQDFPMVSVHEIALLDHDGVSTFYRNVRRPGCSSLLSPISDPAEPLEVRTARLDDIVTRADFLKVDVEGAELQVFLGARQILSHRPFVVFEHGIGGADRYGTGPGELYDLLQEAGLNVSLMWHWLAHLRPLSRPEFEKRFYSGRSFYFLAHP